MTVPSIYSQFVRICLADLRKIRDLVGEVSALTVDLAASSPTNRAKPIGIYIALRYQDKRQVSEKGAKNPMKPTTVEKASRTSESNSPRQMIDDKHDSTAGNRQVSRRTFCNGLLLTSTGLVVGASIAGETVVAQESVLAYPPMKIEGAAKLIVGSSLYFEYPTRNDPAVLLRSSEGEYRAYSRKCSHAGCSVEFDEAHRCFKCPCHQGMFDARIGYVVYGPPQRPLDQIVLQMRAGGEVWAIGKIIGRNADRIALRH